MSPNLDVHELLLKSPGRLGARLRKLTILAPRQDVPIDTIINFLQSSKSKSISYLSIKYPQAAASRVRGRAMSSVGTRLALAIEAHNTTLTRLDLRLDTHFDSAYDVVPPHEKLMEVLNRNSWLTRRAINAAMRCLPVARVLLRAHASPSSPLDSPILQLPLEIISEIVSMASQDRQALSRTQVARLCHHAAHPQQLTRLCGAIDTFRRYTYDLHGVRDRHDWMASLHAKVAGCWRHLVGWPSPHRGPRCVRGVPRGRRSGMFT